MKSMKSLTMKQRLKVCAIMLWRVLLELCYDLPVSAILWSVASVLTVVGILYAAIFNRDDVGDILEEYKSTVSSGLRTARENFKCLFDAKLLVNQILEKEFPDEEEP